jgi:methylphosphotriester-DNA--protein-cysteine methyltransferase
MHVGKCKHYVASHLNKPYNMQDLADHVGLSAKYISDLFRKTEGQTLKSYILQSRIEAAKKSSRGDFSPTRRAGHPSAPADILPLDAHVHKTRNKISLAPCQIFHG